MNIEKIEINGHYVYVDKDAEIKEGDWATDGGSAFKNVAINPCQEIFGVRKKIISASHELNLEGVPSHVEWLAEQYWSKQPYNEDAFIKGYQTAEKELQKEIDTLKKDSKAIIGLGKETIKSIYRDNPTWDDVKKAIEFTLTIVGNNWSDIRWEIGEDKFKSVRNPIEQFIEQLKQSKK